MVAPEEHPVMTATQEEMVPVTPAVCMPTLSSQSQRTRKTTSRRVSQIDLQSIALTREKRSVLFKLAAQREQMLAEKKKANTTKKKKSASEGALRRSVRIKVQGQPVTIMTKAEGRAQQKEKGSSSKGIPLLWSLLID